MCPPRVCIDFLRERDSEIKPLTLRRLQNTGWDCVSERRGEIISLRGSTWLSCVFGNTIDTYANDESVTRISTMSGSPSLFVSAASCELPAEEDKTNGAKMIDGW